MKSRIFFHFFLFFGWQMTTCFPGGPVPNSGPGFPHPRKACGTSVWVRRGGPNYAEGLAKMKNACEDGGHRGHQSAGSGAPGRVVSDGAIMDRKWGDFTRRNDGRRGKPCTLLIIYNIIYIYIVDMIENTYILMFMICDGKWPVCRWFTYLEMFETWWFSIDILDYQRVRCLIWVCLQIGTC